MDYYKYRIGIKGTLLFDDKLESVNIKPHSKDIFDALCQLDIKWLEALLDDSSIFDGLSKK